MNISKAADMWLAARLRSDICADPQVPLLASALYDNGANGPEAESMEAAKFSQIGCSAAAEAIDVLAGPLGLTVEGTATPFELFMYGYAVGAADVGRMLAPESQAALVEAFRDGFETEARD